jgi:excisionase family DNA binding protein
VETDSHSVSRGDVLARWRRRREEWARLKVSVDGATLCEEFLADLQEVLREAEGQVLTLAEAAEYSGYSEDHLRRLVREEKLAAERLGRRLFFKAADLPRKSRTAVDPHPVRGYDPAADARQVAARRKIGEAHG